MDIIPCNYMLSLLILLLSNYCTFFLDNFTAIIDGIILIVTLLNERFSTIYYGQH